MGKGLVVAVGLNQKYRDWEGKGGSYIFGEMG